MMMNFCFSILGKAGRRKTQPKMFKLFLQLGVGAVALLWPWLLISNSVWRRKWYFAWWAKETGEDRSLHHR